MDDQKLNFDQQIAAKAKEAIQSLLLAHPEIRSAALLVDFQPPLDKAPELIRAVWDSGTSIKPDILLGMTKVAVGFQKHLLDGGMAMVAEIEKKALEVGNQLLQRTQELSTSLQATDGHDAPTTPREKEVT